MKEPEFGNQIHGGCTCPGASLGKVRLSMFGCYCPYFNGVFDFCPVTQMDL